MHSGSTILTIFMAPKDAYSYQNFKSWHTLTKRRWRSGTVHDAEEARILENNRRYVGRYKDRLTVLGWQSDLRLKKPSAAPALVEPIYQSSIGDPYYDYFSKFQTYVLKWWGLKGKFDENSKKERNTRSIPNTPMLDVSINLDSNSLMEKMYLKDMTYDEAIATTFKGRSGASELILELTNFNKSEGMDDDLSYQEALRMVEVVQRNIALKNSSPTANEYKFMVEYYNRFVDKKLREMMKIKMNMWFLKEAMTYNPNLSFFVMGPYNILHRIHGIVSKRDQSVIVQLEQFKNSKNYEYEYTYSLAKDTIINEVKKGFIPVGELPKNGSKIINLMYGRKRLKIDPRKKTETFYDMVLDGYSENEHHPWIDAFHNCWLAPDYSNPKNLEGLELLC